MPIIDVYAAVGTFSDQHALAQNLAAESITIEQVPDIPMFRKNTAAFPALARQHAGRSRKEDSVQPP